MDLVRVACVSLSCVALALAGCGSDDGAADPDGSGPGTGSGDPGAGPGGSGSGSGSGAGPATAGFDIDSPPITIGSGEEKTYCYFTTVDIAEDAGVKRWSSTMTSGSHHLIVYFTEDAQEADGTITENCDAIGGGGLNFPIWTYSAQSPEAQNVMPDGVGMTVKSKQHLFVQMHYLNTTADPIEASVHVRADTYDKGESYTPAAAYITFNTQIELPPHGAGSAEGSCNVPSDVSFFTLSTHAHRRATKTWVQDGSKTVFESEDWEHPGAVDWTAAPHYSFGNQLTYHCDYQNDLDKPVNTGNSAETDEMCMAVGYFFPADKPIFCINSTVF
ncbi:MAG: hypothetical protein WKG00_22630 [Polyangiaceae bacterium]